MLPLRLDRGHAPLLSKPPSNPPKAVRNMEGHSRTPFRRCFSQIHFGDMDRSLSEQGLLEGGGPQAASEAVTPLAPLPGAPGLSHAPLPPPPPPMAMMQLQPQNLVPPAGHQGYPPGQVTTPHYDPMAMAALSLNTSSATSTLRPPSLVPTGRLRCDPLRSTHCFCNQHVH